MNLCVTRSVISGLVSNSEKSKPVWSNELNIEKFEMVSEAIHGLVVVTLGSGEDSSRRCFLMKERADASLGVAIAEETENLRRKMIDLIKKGFEFDLTVEKRVGMYI